MKKDPYYLVLAGFCLLMADINLACYVHPPGGHTFSLVVAVICAACAGVELWFWLASEK